jgi:hypothetical protein
MATGLDPFTGGDELHRLRSEATHARERYRLYRAKSYSTRATDPGHLRELGRIATLAEQRLDRCARKN